jgi:RimJ/RimL family protein N-acetyltransferase
MPAGPPSGVRLRPVTDADFDTLFELESDVTGADMIAFLPRDPGDREAFTTHWARITSDDSVMTRIIEADGAFAGYAVSFLTDGERQVGYWITRDLWGRGIATAALEALVAELGERPLWGSTAADNVGSQRVLRNAGFVFDRTERSHAPRRGTEIDENVYRLD